MSGSEIIVRISYAIDGTEPPYPAVPAIFVLANKAGFQEIAEFFGRMADRKPLPHSDWDPDNHENGFLHWLSKSINVNKSCKLELRCGIFDETSRDVVLEHYGIAQDPPQEDLVALFERLLRRVRNDPSVGVP